MVFVKLTEMYDLSTAKDKMGIIAIKTPNMQYIDKKWSGLVKNHKYIRISHCNVRASCASTLPLDPLGIGTEAGKVAPQDLFNPILYKVVSNDSWDGLVNRIYGLSAGNYTSLSGSVAGSANGDAFPNASSVESTNAYYAMLADNSFRKAHPQAGLNIAHVRPFVFPILNTSGQMNTGNISNAAPSSDVAAVSVAGKTIYTEYGAASYLKGHAVPMPRLPTYLTISENSSGVITPMLGYIPPCYCIAIITPPSALQILYYRLVVEWVVEFIELRSDAMLGLITSTADQGTWSHFSNYYTPSSKLDESTTVDSGTLEVDGVNATLVMEK